MFEKKCLLKCLLLAMGFAVLMLILYFYFEDNFMKNYLLLKILICALFVLIAFMVMAILFCPCSNTSFENCKIDSSMEHCDFLLVHKEYNSIKYTGSMKLNELLQNVEDGDKIIIYSDEFSISPDMLYIDMENKEKKKITLISKGNNEFIVSLTKSKEN